MKQPQTSTPARREPAPTKSAPFNLVAMCFEIGWKIAVPLIVFLLLGIKLDRMLDTLPLFMIVGIVLALTVSSIAIWRMVQYVLKRSEPFDAFSDGDKHSDLAKDMAEEVIEDAAQETIKEGKK